jgi:diguanylate cyclase
VVAEGVETEEQRAELGKMACDELQGYLLSRPVPAEQVEKQLFSAEQMELRTSPVKS